MHRYILGIHGLRNKPPESLLKQWWQLAIMEGLERIGQPRINIPFDLIYWADKLYPEPHDPSIKDEDDELYLDERYEWGASAIREDQPKRTDTLQRYVEKQLHQIFLNPDLSLNYEKITDSVFKHFFKDLDKYFSPEVGPNDLQPSARELIRQKMLDLLDQHPNDRIMLIAHSMGSIIAYDVLTQYPERCSQIDLWVTIGSPLGLPIILGKLAQDLPPLERTKDSLRTPSVIKGRWVNYTDPDDRIAFDQLLADDYDANDSGIKVEDISIFNDYVSHEDRNPHKSYGYLRSPEMSKAIAEFLSQPSGYFEQLFGRVLYKVLIPLKRLLYSRKRLG